MFCLGLASYVTGIIGVNYHTLLRHFFFTFFLKVLLDDDMVLWNFDLEEAGYL
jgi:hypothetical protein